MQGLTEVTDKTGYLFQEFGLHPILCKPKLLPLKSVTLEKLENMQKEAQEKFMESQQAPKSSIQTPSLGDQNESSSGPGQTPQQPGTTDVWRPEDESESEPEHSDIRFKRQPKDRYWPEGIVPYEFDPEISPMQKLTILKAMDSFHRYTCILFVPRTGEEDYVKFYKQEKGCDSLVGHWGGVQAVKLENRCFLVPVIMHELMHSLGFWHEHRRHDRDNYIKVLTENVRPALLEDFKPLPFSEFTFLTHPYDYDSLLHYAETDGSKNPKDRSMKTIITWDPYHQRRIGMATGFSKVDIAKIRRVYNCPASQTRKVPRIPDNNLMLVSNAVGVICADRQANCDRFQSYCDQPIIGLQCPATCGTC